MQDALSDGAGGRGLPEASELEVHRDSTEMPRGLGDEQGRPERRRKKTEGRRLQRTSMTARGREKGPQGAAATGRRRFGKQRADLEIKGKIQVPGRKHVQLISEIKS